MKNHFFDISKFLLISAFIAFLSNCTMSPEKLKKVMKENPDIITETIKENPKEFMMAFDSAYNEFRKTAREESMKKQAEEREQQLKNPLKPSLENRVFLGPKDAPVNVVVISDFKCPYCADAAENVKELLKDKKYKTKVKYYYKHFPIKTMEAARVFEAVALQDPKKAFKWHDVMFENQMELHKKDKEFMFSEAKKLGLNMDKLKKDVEKSEKISEIIEQDLKEVREFGVNGTPAILINGVLFKGLTPVNEMKSLIDKLLKE